MSATRAWRYYVNHRDSAKRVMLANEEGRRILKKQLSDMHELLTSTDLFESYRKHGEHTRCNVLIRTMYGNWKPPTKTDTVNPRICDMEIDALLRIALLPIPRLQQLEEAMETARLDPGTRASLLEYHEQFTKKMMEIRGTIVDVLDFAYGYYAIEPGYLKALFNEEKPWDLWVSGHGKEAAEDLCCTIRCAIKRCGVDLFDNSTVLFLGAGIGDEMEALLRLLKEDGRARPRRMVAIENEKKYAEAILMRGFKLYDELPTDLSIGWGGHIPDIELERRTIWQRRTADIVIFSYPPDEMSDRLLDHISKQVRRVLKRGGIYLQNGTRKECCVKLDRGERLDSTSFIAFKETEDPPDFREPDPNWP